MEVSERRCKSALLTIILTAAFYERKLVPMSSEALLNWKTQKDRLRVDVLAGAWRVEAS